MAMTDGRVPRLAALVREAAAVLAAILIAFALDAWWDARTERRDMEEALDAVASEVDRNLVIVDSTRTYNAAQARLVDAALRMDADAFAEMSDADLARFVNLPDYLVATLELGAIGAFIEGGFLGVVDDTELRADLAAIPALQTELDEEATVVFTASDEVNRAFLGLVSVERLLELGGVTTLPAMREFLVAMAGNDEARTALYQRTFFLSYLYDAELQITERRLEELAGRLEAALGRR